jgi:hypothetical protein
VKGHATSIEPQTHPIGTFFQEKEGMKDKNLILLFSHTGRSKPAGLHSTILNNPISPLKINFKDVTMNSFFI